jgi:DNA polymerase-1
LNDGIIVDADYSQIELRLMAQYSRDVNLINDFNTGKDIHTSTASKIFNVDLKDVTKDMRSDAKAVNFGIIYGIGAYGLAKNINKSIKDATAFMKTYFERYKSVKEYMKKAVEDACKNNRAYTMYGRFRNIPELSSTNKNIRAFGERVSMNMPLQGTASDIIKIAMINVYNDLIKNNLKSKLIIQVHDELVIDCEKSELEKVKKLLQDDMENVCKLVVPLKVELNYGKNWYDAK